MDLDCLAHADPVSSCAKFKPTSRFRLSNAQRKRHLSKASMSVYDPLRAKLDTIREQTVRLTFSEIEDLLGRPLPASAYKFSAWWGNESSRKTGHTQSTAWLLAGFEARVSLKHRAVEFKRKQR